MIPKVTIINNKINHPIFILYHQMIYQDSNLNSSNNRNMQMMRKKSLNNNNSNKIYRNKTRSKNSKENPYFKHKIKFIRAVLLNLLMKKYNQKLDKAM